MNGYLGVCISSSGRRFLIDHATEWNMLNDAGYYHGQTAMFSSWQTLQAGKPFFLA